MLSISTCKTPEINLVQIGKIPFPFLTFKFFVSHFPVLSLNLLRLRNPP